MKIAPAFLPDLRTILPAVVLVGEEHFEAFRKARLARSVSTDHEHESPPLRESQRGVLSDAAKAFDGERGDVHTRRLRPRRVSGFLRRLRLLELFRSV